MKKVFKFLAYALGGVVALLALAALYIQIKGAPTYEYNPPPEIANLKVQPDSIRVAQGAKIASLLCNECHRDFETGRLTGHLMTDMPKEFGTIASLNITQDKEHGIGNWTDGEIYYYLRRSIRKDGHYNPVMGGLSRMSDEDVYSIIAWLRSDAANLQPDPKEYPDNKWNFLVKFLANTVFKPAPLPSGSVKAPNPSDKVAYGRYIADDLCSCYACHSADFKTMDPLVPSNSEGYYGGGNPMLNYVGEIVPSANLTMDKETGLGNWTEQQFVEAVRFNKKPGGGGLLNYPMFPHTALSDTEVGAVWAFLQTIPAIKNPVARYQPK